MPTGKPLTLETVTGKQYGKLAVIGQVDSSPRGEARFLCKCECGKGVIVRGYRLRNGHTKSCGCWKRTHMLTHGMSKTIFYGKYVRMHLRCMPDYKRHKDYYDRGIRVCNEWNSFEQFRNDTYDAFLVACEKHGRNRISLDRIDNNGGYSKENCRWSTPSEQMNNTRQNHFVTYRGRTMTLSQWRRFLGMPRGRFEGRINAGWPIKKAIETP